MMATTWRGASAAGPSSCGSQRGKGPVFIACPARPSGRALLRLVPGPGTATYGPVSLLPYAMRARSSEGQDNSTQQTQQAILLAMVPIGLMSLKWAASTGPAFFVIPCALLALPIAGGGLRQLLVEGLAMAFSWSSWVHNHQAPHHGSPGAQRGQTPEPHSHRHTSSHHNNNSAGQQWQAQGQQQPHNMQPSSSAATPQRRGSSTQDVHTHHQPQGPHSTWPQQQHPNHANHPNHQASLADQQQRNAQRNRAPVASRRQAGPTAGGQAHGQALYQDQAHHAPQAHPSSTLQQQHHATVLHPQDLAHISVHSGDDMDWPADAVTATVGSRRVGPGHEVGAGSSPPARESPSRQPDSRGSSGPRQLN